METKPIEEDTMSEGIDDHYQIQVIDGEQVYAFNICDEGFDTGDEVKKHISVSHKDVLIEISEKIDEDEVDNCIEESYGDAWLVKYDDDGNLID